MQVNRYLKDKQMDHVDHALGRPVDPLADTLRDHFAVSCDAERDEFRALPFWREGKTMSGMTWFHVSDDGRRALASHLKEIGDQHRLFEVLYDPGGYETWPVPVAATSHSKARYSYYLDVSDCRPDLTYMEFCKDVSVRLAANT